jgi:ABC-type nitrate/sulfonate/bicarbonate transport system substrate-binding protein
MVILLSSIFWLQSPSALAADRLVGIYSARVMSQSLPWMARDAGLFRKHDLDFQLVFVASSAFVTAAMLGGDAEISLLGGIGRFLRAIGEASKILHTDKEFAYKVLAKELRVNDRKVLDAAYNAEITALERRLDIKAESLQAILDEVSQVDPRAKKIKPQDLVDRRYLDEMEQSGFFNKLWTEKR